VEDIRGLVAAHMPGYEARSVRRLGEGWINVAYEINGELIVRLRKKDDPMTVEAEARLLEFVAGISPLPVPRPAFTAAERKCLAYFKVPGAPLSELSFAERAQHVAEISATVDAFLRRIQAVPLEEAAELVKTDAQPPAGWLADAKELYAQIRPHVPQKHWPAIDRFFESGPTGHPDRLVFSHNDLGIEHVLVDPNTWQVVGIIDWGDAAITDPAYDYGLLYRDLGPTTIEAIPDELRERAEFYARCNVFEDLAYGIEHERAGYVESSLASMEWLFPPH
jgi:aminoglycoside phosphotransferase (APT) family kinase protein